MVVLNIGEHIPEFSRYNGGWIKTITKIDKDYKNGYSLVGEFLPVSTGNIDLESGVLYLDCSIDGSRKNQERNYTLFKIVNGEVEIIHRIEDGGRDWATSLWEVIENELGTLGESKVDGIIKQISSLKSDEIKILLDKVNGDAGLKLLFSKLCEYETV